MTIKISDYQKKDQLKCYLETKYWLIFDIPEYTVKEEDTEEHIIPLKDQLFENEFIEGVHFRADDEGKMQFVIFFCELPDNELINNCAEIVNEHFLEKE